MNDNDRLEYLHLLWVNHALNESGTTELINLLWEELKKYDKLFSKLKRGRT